MWRGQRASNAIKSEGLRLQVDVAMEIKKGGEYWNQNWRPEGGWAGIDRAERAESQLCNKNRRAECLRDDTLQ